MLGQISAVPLRDDLPRHESGWPEATSPEVTSRAMRRRNLIGELDKLLDMPDGLSAAEQERVLPTPALAASPPKPSRRRFLAPAISFGIVLYLISVGLVAGATIAVFFGAGFFLLVQPAGEPISGNDAYDPRIDAQSAASDPLTASSAEAAASSVAPAGRRPVADAAPPPETNDAAGNSAALPPEGDAPKGVAGDNVSVGSDAPAAKPTSASPEPAAATPEPAAAAPEAAPTSLAAPPPASPILHLSPAEISDLLGRGDAYLRMGDLASARLFYERAAVAGDSRAALRVAATFDPNFLSRAGLRSARGDAAEARLWYSRALDLGAAEAKHRPESLPTKQGR